MSRCIDAQIGRAHRTILCMETIGQDNMLFSDFLRNVEASIRERGIEPSVIQLTYISDAETPDSYDGEWRMGP